MEEAAIMEFLLPKEKFPLNQKDYTLYEEVGQGMSATVYRALCIPLDEIVAIKVIDFDKCNNDMDMIRREVQTMILLDHPNLLKALCSFTASTSLWIVMPYMAAGSCLHIIKSDHPNGFEEHTIVTLLHAVIKVLAYLHSHGHIHRDVKAGNILVNSKGPVKLADFGVSTSLFDSGIRLQSKNTFVGTPCWMAPEVMQQLHGYDFKADIWSFGITALELAHGHASLSKYPPMKDMSNGCTRPYFGESVDSVNRQAACVVPAVYCILQQNAMKMEKIIRLIEVVDKITGKDMEFPEAATIKKQMLLSLASAREKILEAHVILIEKKIEKLVGELHIQKMKNIKLERQLSQVGT